MKTLTTAVGVVVGLCGLLGTLAYTADQAILGKSFVIKDPQPGIDATKRAVTVLGKEELPDDTIVGDPTVGGATIDVIANGATPGSQNFVLPPSGWVRMPTNVAKPLVGFKYVDKLGTNGPVKSALIKNPGNGKPFILKAVVSGKIGSITVLPPDPGTDGGMILTIGGGDRYCVTFGGAAGGLVVNQPAKPPQNKTFKIVSNDVMPTSEAGCPSVGPTTTTTTVPGTTSTTGASSSTTTTVSTTTTTSTVGTTTSTTVTTATTTSTTNPSSNCGNGVEEGTEECDDGNEDNTDACTNACEDPSCGDGFVWTGHEQCEDGNTNPSDCCANCLLTPPVCGNGCVQAGETCDDGNTLNGDPCPSDCSISPCTPTATRVDTTVRFTRPTGVSVGGILVYITYSDGRVSLPGTALDASVKARVTMPQTGFTINTNDFDYAIRIAESAANRVLNPANPLFRISFDLCQGQTAPTASAFTCTVLDAAEPDGDTLPLTGITCTVSVP